MTSGEKGFSVGNEDARALTRAVTELTKVVTGLDELLRRDYPKRSEIEQRFTSKHQSRRVITIAFAVAVLTVLGCFGMSTGVYATCFVGEEDPGFCKVIPGYDERIERRDELDEKDRQLRERIEQLERLR